MRKSISAAVIAFSLLAALAGCEEDDEGRTTAAEALDISLSAPVDSLGEGDQVAAELVLGADPGGNVTITVTSDDTESIGMSADGGTTVRNSVEVTFDASNWDTAQEVILVGRLDGAADGDKLVTLSAALEGEEAGDTREVTVTDLSGVRVAEAAPGADSRWSLCFSETYDQTTSAVLGILDDCSGSYLMLACRPAGDPDLQVAAYAHRDDVTFATALDTTSTHTANGTQWYYGFNRSWGFAPEGAAMNNNTCDTLSGDSRMCWQMASSALAGGYRCGDDIGLASSSTVERLIYQAD